MKILTITLFAGLIAPLFSYASNCPSQVEKMSCTVTYNEGNGPKNTEVNFSVKEGTFLCDGKPNKSFEKTGPLGDKFQYTIMADFYNIVLSIHDKQDEDRRKPYAEVHTSRIKSEEKDVSPVQGVSTYLPGNILGQILCETVE